MLGLDVSSCLFLVGGTALLGVVGCSSPSVAPASSVAVSPARSPSPLDAVSLVQSHPLYQQAEQACQHKQFHKAARLLSRLAASPSLSADAVTFLHEQRDLCLRDAGEKVAPSVVVVSSTPVPPSVSASSVASDCGPRALALVCQRLGVSATLARLRELAGTSEKGTSMAGLAKAAEAVGLKAEGVQVSREGLGHVELPALAWVNSRHYVVVWEIRGDTGQGTATIRDPNQAQEETIPREKLLQLCGGYLLLLHR
jgi:hypothetical protein